MLAIFILYQYKLILWKPMKGMQNLLSRIQAGSGKTAFENKDTISCKNVHAISLDRCDHFVLMGTLATLEMWKYAQIDMNEPDII